MQRVKLQEKLALSVSSMAFFAVTVYTLRALISVGVPLMVQVVLLILKPAGSVGATVQLLSVYTVTAKNAIDDTDSASFSLTVNPLSPNLANAVDQIAAIGSAIRDITFVTFARLEGIAFTSKEKLALSLLFAVLFAVTRML
jgi:hypothetical protein